MKRNIAVGIIAVFIFIGCGRNLNDRQIEIRGAAGRDVHDPFAMIVQDQYVLQYAIKNVSSKELTFDRIEEIWSFTGQGAGLTQTVLPQDSPWRLEPGKERIFISNTDGYTLQLHEAAKGKPITLSITLFRGRNALFGPRIAVLPSLKDLPRTDFNLLVLRSSGVSSDIDLSKLPVPELRQVVINAE